MEILQIVGIGIVSTILVVLLRQSDKEEFALLVSLVTGIVIFSMVLDKLRYVVETLSQIVKNTSVEFVYFSIILKIIGIAYIVEFGAQISRDAGEDAIASKIELGGKVIMMVLAMPILLALMDLIINKALEEDLLESLSEEIISRDLDPYSAKDKVLELIKQ